MKRDFPIQGQEKRRRTGNLEPCDAAPPNLNCEPAFPYALPLKGPLLMHGFEDTGAKPLDDPNDKRPWYKLLNRYHWFVLVVAALGWLFDTMDQQLFNLARTPAITELLGAGAPKT